MKNETKFLITVRFPAWGYPGGNQNEYPPFAVRYLINVPNDLLYKDELKDPVIRFFKEKYKSTIGRNEKDFDGEVLFVEEFECVIL